MASKKPAKKKAARQSPHPAVTESRALEYSDFDTQGARLATKRWNETGKAKTRTRAALKKTTGMLENPNLSEKRRKSLTKDKNNYEALLKNDLVQNVSVDIESAANRRVDLIEQGVQRHKEEGDIRTGAHPSGKVLSAGWYFDHADRLNLIADSSGFDRERVYAASGAMSPQNDPENEKRAIEALAIAERSNHPVTATTIHGAKLLGIELPNHIKTDDDLKSLDTAHRTRNFRDIDSSTINRALRTGSNREHFDTKVDIEGLAVGGTGLQRGVDVFRGNLGVDEFLAEGPAGGPKVASYVDSIRRAGRASLAEKSEYHRRMQNAVEGADPYFEQETLFGPQWEKDPWRLASSTEGTLNPKGPTAEDTWMTAISAQQPKEFETIPTGRGAGRVGKFVGSDSNLQKVSVTGIHPTPVEHPNLTSEAVVHAMNNAATHRGSEILTERARSAGRDVGAGVPAMGVQESSWSEYRIKGDKDPVYNEAKRSRSAEFHGSTKSKDQPRLPGIRW